MNEKKKYDERRRRTAHSAPYAVVSPRGVLLRAPRDCANPLEGRISYDPYKRYDLPNALARVTDERSALRFARVYGLLGYADLLGWRWAEITSVDRRRLFDEPLLDEKRLAELVRDLEGEPGDPMPWLLAQARSVRLTLELIEALARQDIAGLRSVVMRHTLPHEVAAGESRPQLLVSGGLTVKWFDPGPGLLQPYPGANRARPAAHLIEDLVNPNLAALRTELFTPAYRGEDDLVMELGPQHTALFEVIWWHVGNAAFGGRPGARVRLCELPSCRAPFIVTDDRQRFCPADYTYTDKRTGKTRPGRSRCAALYQKRYGKGEAKP